MRLARFAGLYEFQACTHGGWTAYLNDLHPDRDLTGGIRCLGHWGTLEEAHAAVGAPAFDDEEDNA